MTDTKQRGTRAEYRNLTHAEMCREGCGRFILGTQKQPSRVVVANVYVDTSGAVAQPPGGTWGRTVVYHPDCYDDRYGPATGSPIGP